MPTFLHSEIMPLSKWAEALTPKWQREKHLAKMHWQCTAEPCQQYQTFPAAFLRCLGHMSCSKRFAKLLRVDVLQAGNKYSLELLHVVIKCIQSGYSWWGTVVEKRDCTLMTLFDLDIGCMCWLVFKQRTKDLRSSCARTYAFDTHSPVRLFFLHQKLRSFQF